MSEDQRDLHTLWVVVEAKLLSSLRANSFSLWSSGLPVWADIPQILANRGLFLRGLPAICAPDVRDDRVHSDLISWSKQQLLELEKALDQNVVGILERQPLSRRVIYELVEQDGSLRDSTLGFSKSWIFENMFPEALYERSNASTLRALNVESFTKLLTDAGIFYPTGSLRWNTLPGKLWETNQYITGIPRSCVPKVVDDKMAGDEASLMMKWKKSQRIDLQRAIDSGLLKIIPRDPGRQVIFEVLEPNGCLRDDDCGFSHAWKAKHAYKAQVSNGSAKHRRSDRSKSLSASTSVPVPESGDCTPPVSIVPPFPWQQLSGMSSGLSQSSKKAVATERYAAILRIHGLLLDSPDGPAFVYVPQLLSTRRCIIQGLPRNCLPIVRCDEVVANYDPRQWSTNALNAFIQAFDAGQIQVVRNARHARALYRTIEESGCVSDETLGFSEKWLEENVDPVDLTAQDISPSLFVTEMWLHLLEGANIPCNDHRGRRRIPWLQLPQTLAHRRGFISGCPIECHPIVEDDIVAELSSPYFWNESQLSLMTDAFTKNKVSIAGRHPDRNVLFTYEKDGLVIDSTCGFSPQWLKLNLHSIPQAISVQLPPQGSASLAPFIVPIAKTHREQSHFSNRNPKRPSMEIVTGYPKAIQNSEYSAPTISSVTSLDSPEPSSQQIRISETDQSGSLKIVIPAHKRRKNTHAQKEANAKAKVEAQSNVKTRRVIPGAGRRPAPPLNTDPTCVPQHMKPTKQLVKPVHPSSIQQPGESSSSTSEEDKPGLYGIRSSTSPPLPPINTLPNPLPPVPLPTFLPIPGGNLAWDHKRRLWELVVSEMWPPEEWKKRLPVFPARILWNPVQAVWMCEPSTSLTKPPHRLSSALQASVEASKTNQPLPQHDKGLSIIWHRWRRTWGLFEYKSPIAPPST